MSNKAELLNELKIKVEKCQRCLLYKTRTNVVFGSGSVTAELMLIGEAPGYWEDKKGEPFVGRAGKFLDELLETIKLKREEVFITNILKCRPPKNREPTQEEIKACTPYLERQLAIIKPKIIITLGNVATSYILQKFGFKPQSISRVRGKVFRVSNLFYQLKIIPMYHPATALYNPRMKEVLREDWKKIKELIG